MIVLIGISALSIFIYMLGFYLVAQAIRNNSIVDIGWGPGFLVISLVLIIFSGRTDDSALLMAGIVGLWAIRLCLHIGIRNSGKPEDFRYANWRREWGKKQPWIAFCKVFMLQGLVMLVVALPIISFFNGGNQELTWINYAGIGIFMAGFLFESIGDYQLSIFKKKEKNKGKIIQSGLWKYTRHPNYFGEALLWWGIWLLSAGSGLEYITVISPLTITLLLRFGSGVPMLEEKYREREDFREYAKRTPVFVPFVGKRGV